MRLCNVIAVWVQENLSIPIGGLPRRKKSLYSYSLDPPESGMKLNSVISKESSSIFVLKPVPRLFDGPAWVEENQQNKPAFGGLTNREQGEGGLPSGQPSPSWLTPSWGLLQREVVTGMVPGAPVSLTKALNRHCVFPLQMRKMTWWEGICLCPESQIPGAEKAKRNAASQGAISLPEDAQSRALANKGNGNAAVELRAVDAWHIFMRHGQWVAIQKAKAASS